MPILISLVAPNFVVLSTYGATHDHTIGIMTVHCFHRYPGVPGDSSQTLQVERSSQIRPPSELCMVSLAFRKLWNKHPKMPWCSHQMETFSALLAICAGNSPVPGEFPAQRPVTRSFDVFFDLRLNKRLSKQSWVWWFETSSRPLWRYHNGSVFFLFLWWAIATDHIKVIFPKPWSLGKFLEYFHWIKYTWITSHFVSNDQQIHINLLHS